MKEFAEKFYKGTAWQKVRAQFIADRISKDGGMCQHCHNVPGYIVHHRIELSPANIDDPEISLNPALFEYLCHDCHNKQHGHFRAARRCVFDDDGNVIDCR